MFEGSETMISQYTHPNNPLAEAGLQDSAESNEIKEEEQKLSGCFGQQYADYKKRVGCIIGLNW